MPTRSTPSLMSPASAGALWMLGAACLLASLSLMVRHIASDLHPFEIAFFRNFGQFAFMIPWAVLAGIKGVRTRRVWAHVRRSSFGICAMLTWFWVVTQMPIAEATAISFSAPLFTTAGAALFLRERVGPRRWLATVFGFLGVLMVIRPGLHEVELPALIALSSAVFIAGSMLSNKSLARTESPNAMVLWMGVFMSLFSLPPALAFWSWPTGWTWAWLVALGLVATFAHLAINRAFASSDASFIAPFGFAQIPFVAMMGYGVFGESPDGWTIAGSAVIMASGVYIAHREARVSRAVAAPPQPGVVAVGHEHTP
ncbi:MAG: DMT family transporter [Rhodospirillales bacterium]|nr:DMT family transporter [Rhodospirillales bacterium]